MDVPEPDAQMTRVKKFLPIIGATANFWGGGRPRFSARTSTTRRVLEKFVKKLALLVWQLLFMKAIPESETQVNYSLTREKTQWNIGEEFRRNSPLNFQEKRPRETSRKITHMFHEGRNKTLSPRDSGSGGAPTIAVKVQSVL